MSEARRTYRVTKLDIQQVNFALSLIANRLDELEGRRGTPTFKSDVNMDDNQVRSVADGLIGDDAASLGQVSIQNAILKVLINTHKADTSNPHEVTLEQARTEGSVLSGPISFDSTGRIDWTKITANAVTLVVGTSAETVADLQTAHDGNIYHVNEAAATPGIDLQVDFINVEAFSWVNILGSYEDGGSHALGIQLWNWVASAWQTFHHMQDAVYDDTAGEEVIGNYDFFVPDDTNYIGTGGDSGRVGLRFIHPMGGNASHDAYFDVVALYQ